ncbi:uncharacterized protein [Battus philenor]|uniref:uncharacterized protein n=1 Tax=Battus philenor TaxID=42288 RepID=UPI0035CF752B
MKPWISLFLLVTYVAITNGGAPFIPREGSVQFLVYFLSRYRGMCVGTLVSRSAVLTAAVCVTHPLTVTKDTRPINVIATTSYRHPRRGIRVQVSKIVIPKWPNASANSGYLMQRSPAILILTRQVPDVLAEVPMRGIEVDFDGEDMLNLHEECTLFGWHFFYKGDKIYPTKKFLLQKNMRAQFMNIAIKHIWCDTLAIKYENALTNLGFSGYTDKSAYMCMRDPDRIAQPCHGMYGAPVVCRGKISAMLMAPDAQWTNCTGFTNIVHLLRNSFLQNFMNCVKGLFFPEIHTEWTQMKKSFYEDVKEEYDYLPEMYDKIKFSSTEDT